MTNTNKARGTRTESAVVGFLRWALGSEDIERRALSGRRDRGDVAGLKVRGLPLSVEVKNHSRHDLAGWLDEAIVEADNANAVAGLVVFKRRGTQDPGKFYVLTDLNNFTAILKAAER